MSKFASRTKVDSFKTRSEIERTLHKYGANGFQYGWAGIKAVIAFELKNRRIKFLLPLPDPKNYSAAKHEQLVRSKWRALFLVIKAKLEAVESGITTLEDEFMAHIVLPGNQTVSEFMAPQIEQAYKTGAVPRLLMLGDGK